MDSDQAPPPYGLVTRHVISNVDNKKSQQASLNLVSRAKSGSDIPLFLSSDTIKGNVVLDFVKEKKVKNIVVSVVGWIAAAGYEDSHIGSELDGGAQQPGQRFLEIRETIRPINDSSTAEDSHRLIGHHDLPFEIGLPPIVSLKKGSITNEDRVYDLPPSFREKQQTVNLVYDISLDIKGAGIFSQDFHVARYIRIISSRTPTLPSPRCMKALQAGEMPPGPTEDPDGWTISTGGLFTGIKENAGDLFVNCKMAFLNPLIYARGHALLFHMTLESAESIECLSAPDMFQVCLVRNVSREKNKPVGKNLTVKTDWQNMVNCNAMATLWQASLPTASTSSPNRQEFWGEFALDESLAPSFEFVRPSIHYHVVLLPFNIPGIPSKTTTPLIVQRVQIVAQSNPEVSLNVSYAPPNHFPPPKAEAAGWHDGNYMMVLQSMFSG